MAKKTDEELREKHKDRIKNKPKRGSYKWDTEEERENIRSGNRERIQ